MMRAEMPRIAVGGHLGAVWIAVARVCSGFGMVRGSSLFRL